MNSQRLFVLICSLLLVGGMAGAGGYLWQARQEYLTLAKTEAELNQRLTEAKDRLAKEQAELERLRTDPDYVELKIRQRLGYAKPGELVFKFGE